MLSSELIEVCYSALIAKNGSDYQRKDFAGDIGIKPQDLSAMFNDNRNIGRKTAEKISRALKKYGIKATPGHIVDGLTEDNWHLVPQIAETREYDRYNQQVDLPVAGRINAGTTEDHERKDERLRNEIAGLVMKLKGRDLVLIRDLVERCVEDHEDNQKNIA